VEIDWLEGLESRVRNAVEHLGELREENRTLRDTVKDLETRLAAGGMGDGGVEVLQGRVQDLERRLAEAAAAAKTWDAEREEVRRRVEALTARLEGLAAG
jgi:chromosome segregation ATPase